MNTPVTGHAAFHPHGPVWEPAPGDIYTQGGTRYVVTAVTKRKPRRRRVGKRRLPRPATPVRGGEGG